LAGRLPTITSVFEAFVHVDNRPANRCLCKLDSTASGAAILRKKPVRLRLTCRSRHLAFRAREPNRASGGGGHQEQDVPLLRPALAGLGQSLDLDRPYLGSGLFRKMAAIRGRYIFPFDRRIICIDNNRVNNFV